MAKAPAKKASKTVTIKQVASPARRPADQQATLVGHSLGAHIALRFAGACPGIIHQLVAIEHQIEVSVTMLVGTVAVAFMLVVVCLHAKGGGCQ